MDKKTVFLKTPKGESDGANLSSDLKRILSLIDNKSTSEDLSRRAPPSLRESWKEILGELEEGGYIRDKDKPLFEPKIATPKFNPLKMFIPKSMQKGDVFIKTAKGEHQAEYLSSDLRRILSLVDNVTSSDELVKRAPPSLRDSWKDLINELVAGGYIRDKNKVVAEPKFTAPKVFAAKPDAEATDDLDFHTITSFAANNAAEQAEKQKAEDAAKQKEEEAARERAELENAVAAAKARAEAEAIAKAEAKARLEAESAAHAKALAEAEALLKAETKAKKDAEAAARAKEAAEAKAKQEAALRAQTEAKATQEAAARMQTEQDARAKAALESAIRVRAEIEAAARAQQVAETKAKQETAARMQAQQEAALAKAALEAAARAKSEAEARVRAEIDAAARARQEAEANAKREAEASRLAAEKEAARVKAELEAAAKAKLEAEAALLKAEQEADRIRAELAAAKARAEAEAKALAEARAKQEAEEKIRREVEAARIKAEQEAALVRAEQEAVAKVRAEAKMRAELEAKMRAEAEAAVFTEAEAKVRAETEARVRAEAEARAAAEALARQQIAEAAAKREAEELALRAAAIAQDEALARAAKENAPAKAFEINLDKFLGGAEPTALNVAPGAYYKAPENTANREAEQTAVEASVQTDKNSMQNVAAEMARLKEEAEVARRMAEEEARRNAENRALEEEQAKAWAEAEQRARTQAILEAEQSAQQTALSQNKPTPTSFSRKHRNPLPWGKISFALIVLALVAVIVIPYVYPLKDYISPLEQRLAARLKQPVHIGALSASSLPPRLQLQNVTVGNAQEVKVGIVTLNFNPLSLLSEVKVIGNAELADVSIQGNLLDKQVTSLKQLGADPQYPVRHLTLQQVKIVTDEVALPIMSGIADIDVQGAFNRISLHSADDKLGIDLQSAQSRWQLGVYLKESGLPILPDVVFSDLSAKGDLGDGEVNFTEMDAHIYNGILSGSAKLNWRKGWQLQGHFEAKTFELNKMFPKFHVEGELYGEGSFALNGAKISQMDDDPDLEGSFSVKKGLVNGFDMVETARLLSRENMVGGRTHFDDMIGLVKLDNHVCHFRQVKIVSGALSASGMFDVTANSQLGGTFSTEIKMRPGSNNLILYGTPVEPKMRAGN